MQPYTYSESPLTPYAGRDAEFAGGLPCGSAAPNARLADGSYLLDRAGNGMTAILFCEGQPTAEQAALLAQLGRIDKRFVPIVVTSGRFGLRSENHCGPATAKSPACSRQRPARSICCGPTCTSPGDGRPSFPARS